MAKESWHADPVCIETSDFIITVAARARSPGPPGPTTSNSAYADIDALTEAFAPLVTDADASLAFFKAVTKMTYAHDKTPCLTYAYNRMLFLLSLAIRNSNTDAENSSFLCTGLATVNLLARPNSAITAALLANDAMQSIVHAAKCKTEAIQLKVCQILYRMFAAASEEQLLQMSGAKALLLRAQDLFPHACTTIACLALKKI